MGQPTYRASATGMLFDAFYRDEWGRVNTAANCSGDAGARTGFHKNRFTQVWTDAGQVFEEEGCSVRTIKNRAEPKDDVTVRLAPSADLLTRVDARMAGGKWAGEVSVTLFFGVGAEMSRHGLQSFVQRAPGLHMVIHVQCNEAVKPYHPRVIDDAQIEALLTEVLGGAVPWKLRVIAGYSFGSSGVNTVILGKHVALTNLRRLVFYDCLYKTQFGDTATAIGLAKRMAGTDLRTVVYKTSAGGNSVTAGDSLAVVAANPGLIDRRGLVENLYHSRDFQALCVFRSLQGAIDDRVVTLPASLQKAHDAMVLATASLPRGSVISNKETWSYVRGAVPAGATVFGEWAKDKTNAVALKAYGSQLGTASKKDSFRGILWPNRIPGWWQGEAEDVHDLLIPEIGWEYLTL